MSNTFKIKTLFWICLFTVFQVKANTRSISSEYPDMEKNRMEQHIGFA